MKIYPAQKHILKKKKPTAVTLTAKLEYVWILSAVVGFWITGSTITGSTVGLSVSSVVGTTTGSDVVLVVVSVLLEVLLLLLELLLELLLLLLLLLELVLLFVAGQTTVASSAGAGKVEPGKRVKPSLVFA